ncbi:methylmalonyl Co-A mutase-associated GTPase MeaB [Parafrankia sp. EUN1f]|uniref:methylmalonyl Co-A mutase-associated GTPase MeaB n=1 Tax=Parafrankia sp. EUN1f TaxID=102897 RepID=UPI0001C46FC0|nr:methylmalonyl Co-A mutase-associated GTPase MeaB [Parafrankia sp. EUN1f]EFC86755.1 LAO/AO transport system ATPase [Parafrankia sp. EUN1f]
MAGNDVTSLLTRARAADIRALGRLITLVENEPSIVQDINELILPLVGRAHVVGVTGPPGAGKSTTVGALTAVLRERGRTVAVLAIDPSSATTGGALLGDRLRMHQHDLDQGVFIRSMASRGSLGGLSSKASTAVRVLDAAGFDVVILETVGVGQSEVDIAAVADTTVVILVPGMGDQVQADKAGIIERGDIFVVNKADRGGAETTRSQIRFAVSGGAHATASWTPPVELTTATTGAGVDAVVDAVDRHWAQLVSSGELDGRRAARSRREIETLALELLHTRLDSLAAAVAGGRQDPLSAARELAELLWRAGP